MRFYYKKHLGSIEYDPITKMHYGKILDISDLVLYQAKTIPELYSKFKESVDDYIRTRKDLGASEEYFRLN